MTPAWVWALLLLEREKRRLAVQVKGRTITTVGDDAMSSDTNEGFEATRRRNQANEERIRKERLARTKSTLASYRMGTGQGAGGMRSGSRLPPKGQPAPLPADHVATVTSLDLRRKEESPLQRAARHREDEEQRAEWLKQSRENDDKNIEGNTGIPPVDPYQN